MKSSRHPTGTLRDTWKAAGTQQVPFNWRWNPAGTQQALCALFSLIHLILHKQWTRLSYTPRRINLLIWLFTIEMITTVARLPTFSPGSRGQSRAQRARCGSRHENLYTWVFSINFYPCPSIHEGASLAAGPSFYHAILRYFFSIFRHFDHHLQKFREPFYLI